MQLKKIIIGSHASQPLHYVDSIQAVEGKGLEGDRYYYQRGTFNKPQLDQNAREVTLIDEKALDECNSRLESKLDFLDLRRNLVIANLDYEALKNKTFTIGTAQFKIIRTAPPCRYLSRLLGEDMMKGLKYIGGYRAKILQSGTIMIEDNVIVIK
ncbi:MAG: MOSC domain-containing protein [Campylobacterota bacterium]|nr:MOSC domain-containing protein [Campylobacterota bacterium]